jgi:ribosome-binding ATPase YchF (GTP1/OBG family)
VDPDSVNNGNQYVEAVKQAIAGENAGMILISAAIEAEIADLESFEDRQMFLQEMGLEKSGVEKLIHAAYKLLNYITYFTVGVKEVRAWTITEGTKAPGAAGEIHTDFEKGFIRAEVIAYERSEAACREVGKLRVEGKEYIVKDGDCMHFRFNV